MSHDTKHGAKIIAFPTTPCRLERRKGVGELLAEVRSRIRSNTSSNVVELNEWMLERLTNQVFAGIPFLDKPLVRHGTKIAEGAIWKGKRANCEMAHEMRLRKRRVTRAHRRIGRSRRKKGEPIRVHRGRSRAGPRKNQK